MAKSKIIGKSGYMCLSETRDYDTDQDFRYNPKRGSVCHILNLFHLLMQKNLEQNRFPK